MQEDILKQESKSLVVSSDSGIAACIKKEAQKQSNSRMGIKNPSKLLNPNWAQLQEVLSS